MEDILEKIGNSLIQHGKLNDRVYIMKLNSEDFEKVIKRTQILCKENSYSKIFAKVPKKFAENLLKKEDEYGA